MIQLWMTVLVQVSHAQTHAAAAGHEALPKGDGVLLHAVVVAVAAVRTSVVRTVADTVGVPGAAAEDIVVAVPEMLLLMALAQVLVDILRQQASVHPS